MIVRIAKLVHRLTVPNKVSVWDFKELLSDNYVPDHATITYDYGEDVIIVQWES
jgi:hypothetical protein